jgi:hypothetical protein
MRLPLASACLVAFLLGCSGGADETKAPGVAQLPSSPGARGPQGQPGDAPAAASLDSAPLSTDPGKAPEAPAGPLAAGYVDYAVNHVIVTGQSNSVANGGDPYLTTSQPYSNLMFDSGVMPMSSCDGDGCYGYDAPTRLVPLVEGDAFFDYQVETSASGLANEISKIAHDQFGFGSTDGYPAKHDVLVSLNGRSGNTYWCLRKGSCSYHPDTMVQPFAQGMMDVANAKRLADEAGLSYAVRAVNAIHGESDHYSYSFGTPEFPLDGTDGTPGAIKDYSDALLEWQRDYETEIKKITGQKTAVPLFISQMSTWSDTPGSPIAQWQLDAHARSNGKVVLVAPGYELTVREDCIHYDAAGERRLGEYFAKAYAKTVFGGQTWEPLRPASVSRAGNVVTVKFLVPKAPLVLDTDRVVDPGNFGFDVKDAWGGAVAITSVTLAGPDTVRIELAGDASGGTVSYAMNHQAGNCIGPWQGARGNLRDSDDTPSEYGDELFNWAVHFRTAIP